MRGGLRAIDVAAAVMVVVSLLGLAMLLRGERIVGRPYIVDGDTLTLSGRRIRLRGLDAPELAQTCQRDAIAYRCGEEARAALRDLVAGGEVSCTTSGRDRFERDLATCLAAGEDVGASLVRRGLAFSFGAYAAEEREARAARRGLWAGPFELPQAWRRRNGHEMRS